MPIAFGLLRPLPAALCAVWFAGTQAVDHAYADGRCTGSPVAVRGASYGEFELVCDGAREAIRLLGACGIGAQREMRIDLSSNIRHPGHRDAIAYYDAPRGSVRIPRLETVSAMLADSPYRVLTQIEFYRSMVVHELVHAVLQQNARRTPQSMSEQEYPAYALQIASLPEGARVRLLQAHSQAARGGEFIFNDIVLAFDPVHFALRAYLHFSEADGGCARLRSLMGGEADFIALLP